MIAQLVFTTLHILMHVSVSFVFGRRFGRVSVERQWLKLAPFDSPSVAARASSQSSLVRFGNTVGGGADGQ